MNALPVQIDGYPVRTVADDPALADQIQALIDAVWPAFLLESHTPPEALPTDWMGVYTRWPHLQFMLYDPVTAAPLAGGNALALAWAGDAQALPEEGWMWEMAAGAADHDAGAPAFTLGALSITVLPAAQGRGLSATMLRAMKELGRRAGCTRMIAPVRPTRKADFPHEPMARYIERTAGDGLASDPWLRTHQSVGARIVRPCTRSMLMAGSVDEWRRWTGLEFAQSGDYAFPGGLAPVAIDLMADRGLYIEPNVWMLHEIG